jgi:poly-gamma-glutamate synthase PgsB/CapB
VTFLYLVCAVGCAILLVAGVVERRRHDAALDSIPHRVMVNGIRGKSSVTRLCAGALRAGGLTTVAKTTGSAARFIHPDGSEQPLYRRFDIANIIEQIPVVRRAAAYRPDALVIECMAVDPDLQEFNQRTLVRSTIGVLTNVRADHLQEMGPTLDDVARSLSRAMPVGGVCVTAERDRLPLLREQARRRDCRLVEVDPGSVTPAELAAFDGITFPDNVAVAIAVAELLGVDRRRALAGMRSAPPDPGALTVDTYRRGASTVRVANLFAANDPESTALNVHALLAAGMVSRPLQIVINCRPERVERNQQMGELVGDLDPERVVLIGDPVRSARAAIPADWGGRVDELGGRRTPADLVDGILDGAPDAASLLLVGNIHGQGEVLLDELAKFAVLPSAHRPGTETPTT